MTDVRIVEHRDADSSGRRKSISFDVESRQRIAPQHDRRSRIRDQIRHRIHTRPRLHLIDTDRRGQSVRAETRNRHRHLLHASVAASFITDGKRQRVASRRDLEELLEDHALVFTLSLVERRDANHLAGVEMANGRCPLRQIERHRVRCPLSPTIAREGERSIRKGQCDERKGAVGRAASEVAKLSDERE